MYKFHDLKSMIKYYQNKNNERKKKHLLEKVEQVNSNDPNNDSSEVLDTNKN